MSKVTPNKNIIDLTRFSKSAFTLTFAIEILGMDVWHDCNEGWLDLGPAHQAMKIQYQLYAGQSFDLDVLIWPHIVKIWCGNQFGYVRTWQYLEQRWFAFSIRHAFVARVLDFKNHTATVTCSMGFVSLSNNAKNDKNLEAYLPPLKFGERRYFGPVLEKEETFETFIQKFLWNLIEQHIPASYLDGYFDIPFNVTDIRHQDAVIYNVQQTILNKIKPFEQELPVDSEELLIPKERRESKLAKDKEKEKKKAVEVQKEKFSITLTGDAILAGAGRITIFNTTGDRPTDQSNVMVFISSSNLPAYDDLPIIFINIEKLHDLPVEEFRKASISQIYTRWKLGDEEHASQKENVKLQKPINFDDHHTKPLQFFTPSEITVNFLDNPFEIEVKYCSSQGSNHIKWPACFKTHFCKETERGNSIGNEDELEIVTKLRGIRQTKSINSHQYIFGSEKNDRNIGHLPSNMSNEEQDLLVAVTKIDACSLSKGVNGLIRGEFPLYPPTVSVTNLPRKTTCTNDINAIRVPVKPNIAVQPSIILKAQMTLEVTLGKVGCKPQKIHGYLRLYCLTCDLEAINTMQLEIAKINKLKIDENDNGSMLTGFLLDTHDTIILYVEGPDDGEILNLWKLTAAFHSTVKILFSCAEKYLDRIYPEMISNNMAFQILKTFVPLSNSLGCPQIYVKPTLPLPAKSALLKIGRLIASKLKVIPYKNEIPTKEELESFKLELCVPSHLEENNY